MEEPVSRLAEKLSQAKITDRSVTLTEQAKELSASVVANIIQQVSNTKTK